MKNLFKYTGNKLSYIGAAVKEGQKQAGVDLAPDLFRKAGLFESLQGLGWEINDLGDVSINTVKKEIQEQLDIKTRYEYHPNNIEILGSINKRLCELAEAESKKNRFVLTTGGDHSIASGTIAGILRNYSDLKVVWIDAHGDLNWPEISPSGNYHGMPAAHLLGWMKKGSVKSFDWLNVNLKPENIAYIGLRDLDAVEKIRMAENNIRYYTPYDIENVGGINKVMDEIFDYLKWGPKDESPIHVSFDVDGCDPSYIYGTGTKARFGVTDRESNYLLQRIANTGNLISMDLVEVNVLLEKEKITEKFHGDSSIIKTEYPSIRGGIELMQSALGFSWRR